MTGLRSNWFAPLAALALLTAGAAQASDSALAAAGNASFPSGETTEVFAVASVLAARTGGWVVPVVSYTFASRVGFARVHAGAHGASDAIAGGLVGALIGRTVVGRHERQETQPDTPAPTFAFHIAPVISQGGIGFSAEAFF